MCLPVPPTNAEDTLEAADTMGFQRLDVSSPHVARLEFTLHSKQEAQLSLTRARCSRKRFSFCRYSVVSFESAASRFTCLTVSAYQMRKASSLEATNAYTAKSTAVYCSDLEQWFEYNTAAPCMAGDFRIRRL